MKRFLTPAQWKVVALVAVIGAALRAPLFFVRRAIGWDPVILSVTNNPTLNVVFDIAISALIFALLVAVFMHYGIWAKDTKRQK